MKLTWVQDRTGRNVIHRAAVHTDVRAADNCDPEVATAEDAAEWVSVSPCVR